MADITEELKSLRACAGLMYLTSVEAAALNRVVDECERLTLANIRIRVALREACDMRAALCRNSDPEDDGGDPSKWDAPLKRWLAAMQEQPR